MAFFGVDVEGGEPPDARYPVLRRNLPIVRAFQSVATQWRTSFAGVIGLDYTGVRDYYRMSGRRLNPRLFGGICVMERAVLRALAERHDNGQ